MSSFMQAGLIGRDATNRWVNVVFMLVLVMALMLVATGAYATDGAEFEQAAETWGNLMRGNFGKLAALFALAVGSVLAAFKKDWGAFVGAVGISLGIGIILTIIENSFTAVI